jgi:hypothetical protein
MFLPDEDESEMNSSLHDERISSYLDDAMSAAERSAFQAELARDPELRQHVADLQQLRADVAALPRYKVQEGFAERVVTAALAAKSATNPATTKVELPKRHTGFRAATAILVSAALLGGLMVIVPWFKSTPSVDPVANNLANNTPVVAEEVSPLQALRASLPGEGEALVLRIRSPKDLAAGKLLREALAEQGIEKRRPADRSTSAPLVGKAYRDQLRTESPDAQTLSPAADALYVEMSAEELELALARLAEPHKELQFVPERKLAVASSTGATGSPNNTAAGESAAVVNPDAPQGDFVQELSASLFRLPKTNEGLKPNGGLPAKPSPGKVRVLILIEAE